MDGNRRWAKLQKLSIAKGHEAGLKKMIEIIDACISLNIQYVSFYSFSNENWFRSIKEIYGMFRLIDQHGDSMIEKWKSSNARVIIIGDKQNLPDKIKLWIEKVEHETKSGTSITISLAVNYSGRKDILNAVQQLSKKPIANLTEKEFSNLLYTRNIPDPDLCIRTGYESRLSNFFLWQMAYTEIMFLNMLWPEFSSEVLKNTLEAYKNKDRRLGM